MAGILRRIAPRLVLALVGLAVALVVAELAVRLVRPQAVMTLTPGLYLDDPPGGYRLRPGHHGSLGNRVEFDTTVAVGPRGLRIDPAATTGEPAAARRLLAVGDSFTFGVGVEAQQAWPARAAELLAAAGVPLVGLNAGAPGYGVPDAVRWIERHGDEVAPEVVVLGIFVGNDLQNAAPGAPHMEVHAGQLVLPGERPGVKSWLYQHSQLYVLAKNAIPAAAQGPLRELLGLPEPWALRELRLELELYRQQPTEMVRQGAAATAAALDRLEVLAHERGFVVVAVLLPSLIQVDPAAWNAVLAQLDADPRALDPAAPTHLLAELIAARGIAHVDASPALAREIAAGARPYFPIDRHLTAAGHEVVARLVAELVRERLASVPTAEAPPGGTADLATGGERPDGAR